MGHKELSPSFIRSYCLDQLDQLCVLLPFARKDIDRFCVARSLMQFLTFIFTKRSWKKLFSAKFANIFNKYS